VDYFLKSGYWSEVVTFISKLRGKVTLEKERTDKTVLFLSTKKNVDSQKKM
jgi:hypothetical protein